MQQDSGMNGSDLVEILSLPIVLILHLLQLVLIPDASAHAHFP